MRRPLSSLVPLLAGAVSFSLAQGTTPPGPTHPGVAANCNAWHVVHSGDTCTTIETQYGITHAQFIAWNPAVSVDCISNFWAEYAYCVGVGTSPPSSTTTTTASPTRITIPPGPTFTDTPANCKSWHLVESGDNCATIESQYGITHAEFLAWIPSVSADCVSNFWAGYAYCVGLGPPISSTSSASTTETTSSTSSWWNSTYSIRHPVTSWTITTPTVDNSTWPPTVTQPGQPTYCSDWHVVVEGETCRDIWSKHKTWMTLADFFAWNPAVGTDCSGLYIGYYVCVDIRPQTALTITFPKPENFTLPEYFSWTPAPLPTVDSNFTPTPSHGPMPTNCISYYPVKAGETCDDVLADNQLITREQFFEWNPVLGGNCNGLWANNYYCIFAFDEENLPLPWTAKTKPEDVPADSATNCVAWYRTTDGDDCYLISVIFSTFSEIDFKTWNPSVGSDCSNLEIGVHYCVAIPDTPTTRTTMITLTFPEEEPTTPPATTTDFGDSTTPATTSPPTTTTSEAAISTPQPIQGTMVEGCRRFYFVQPGDGCWQIATDAGITVSQFYEWNPAAAPDCSGMWANVYVCVGISGPVATFSGIPPQPT